MLLVQTLRGRIDLNDGKPAEAKLWFEKALASAGGLGTRINAADIRIRGDLALATYQLGDKNSARKYLAYTGAGSLPEHGFEFGADMSLPACAPTGALKRDDMAIVEFSLGDDGRVHGAAPIYVNRRGGPEQLFTRAVRDWSWRPEAARALPAFWRQSVRMELRCVNRSPSSPENWALDPALLAWLAEHAPEPMPTRCAAMPRPCRCCVPSSRGGRLRSARVRRSCYR